MITAVQDHPDWPSIDTLEEKLLAARCRLLSREPWMGAMAMQMTWHPGDFPWQTDDRAKTMGVRIVNGGEVQCIWYPGFVHSQSIKQLYAVIQHEIEHIVRCHCIRIGSHRCPERWNVACDMAVNGKRSKPTFGYTELLTGAIVLPLDGNCVFLPEEWDSDQTTEALYDKLGGAAGASCPICGSTSNNNCGQPGGKPRKGGKKRKDACPNCASTPSAGTMGGPGQYAYGGYSGGQIDDHNLWSQSDISAEEARQLIKDMTDQATAKCLGHAPGHLTEVLAELRKPIVRWRELLRTYIGQHVGNRRNTYSRRNRRNDAFGLPGISHHAAATVVCIVDTSGSISSAELSQFFAEIEQIASGAEIRLLQWDHNFQGFEKYRRGDWKKLTVRGRGGTDMAGPIYWLGANRLIPDCVIMLTDGWCTFATPQPWYPDKGYITVITTPKGTAAQPSWGRVVWLRSNE